MNPTEIAFLSVGVAGAMSVLGLMVGMIRAQTRRIQELSDAQTESIKEMLQGIQTQVTALDGRVLWLERRRDGGVGVRTTRVPSGA